MRTALAALALLAPLISRADEPIELRWRAPAAGEIVAFAMWQNEEAHAPAFDLDKIAGGQAAPRTLFETPSSPPSPKLAVLVQRGSASSLLVEMVAMENLLPDDKANSMFGPGSVQEWCEIGLDGQVRSFWKPERSRNMFVLLFALPKDKVRVGDSWPLATHFIDVAGYRPKRAERVAAAKLVALRPEGADTVAIIEYTAAEAFTGVPLVADAALHAQQMKLSMGFVGRGEFLVHAGRWKQLLGWMQVQSSDMKASASSVFGMRYMPTIPAVVKKAIEQLR